MAFVSARSAGAAAGGALVAALIAACSSTSAATPAADVDAASARVDEIQSAVTTWSAATSVTQARAAAEAARNLVLGPEVTGYGDTDGDGTVAGASDIGLLPDESGGPGLALPLQDCAGPDLLGGSWADPAARWDVMRTAIDAWTPGNNTFPALPSHPQRVVGWATLTLGADDLAAAVEYAGHAQLHVDATRDAIAECS